MVKFINKLTGSIMYVDDSRAEEYQKAGHKKVEPKEEPKAESKATPKKKPATKKK